jgi:glycogen operon protein
LPSPPVLWDIESDPVLANVKLIAEAWDAAGLYQVGSFIGESWKEWNGRFRDDVRAFTKGDHGKAGAVAQRLLGSPDIYGYEEREPEQSINFITCHDGFTLNDLVCYNDKHNEANGEENRDGSNDNLSWNCGVEGPTDDQGIERLRNRQVKNYLTLTLLSIGTPMLLMGDEVRRSQNGNNNVYCQDNEMSWFDWDLVARHADIHRFMKQLVAVRQNRLLPIGRQDTTLNELLHKQPVQWHGVKLNAPDWSHESHVISATVSLPENRLLLHIMVNAYWEELVFEIPPGVDVYEPWRRCIDTFLDSPDDVCDWLRAPDVDASTYRVQPRSVVILMTRSRSNPGTI